MAIFKCKMCGGDHFCQTKVGNPNENRHNAQNQQFKSVKDLREEIFLSHFIEEGILCIGSVKKSL